MEQTCLTDAKGEIHLTSLEVGTYVFTETKPKDGYWGTTQEGKPITGTIEAGEEKEYAVTVENEAAKKKEGACRIRKVDQETNEALRGAVFALNDAEGNRISTQTTDGDGYATFTGLMPNHTYQVAEITPPVGYESTPSLQSVSIQEGETKELRWENKKKKEETGRLTVVKKEESGNPLAGALFVLTNMETGETFQKQTDSSGTLTFAPLALGEYRLEETIPPAGYQLAADPVKRVLVTKEERTLTVTFVNQKEPEKKHPGTLRIQKVDADTKEALAGVTFRIGKGKEEVARGVTDAKGILKLSLEEGVYWVQEMEAPQGYRKEDTLYTVTLQYGKTETLTISNQRSKGRFVMNKVDALSGEPIPHCTFLILNAAKEEIFRDRTDAYGFCQFTLPVGVYYYQELEAAPGYVLDSNPYRFEITKDQQVISETMKNRKEGTGELILWKYDKETKEPLAGCQFVVKGTQGEVQTGTTKENGSCSFQLPLGTYTYQEVKAVSGYQLDPSVHTVSLKESGGRVHETVWNQKETTESQPAPSKEPKPTGKPEEPKPQRPTLTLLKEDYHSKERLAGCRFAVFDTEGSQVAEGETDANGMLRLPLKAGSYQLQEVKAASGYLLDETRYTVTVTEGGKNTYTITTLRASFESWYVCK